MTLNVVMDTEPMAERIADLAALWGIDEHQAARVLQSALAGEWDGLLTSRSFRATCSPDGAQPVAPSA